jgi:hypothetical protein
MPYAVRATLIADRQIRALRGARRKAYLAFEETLARRGCAPLDYRLTGEEPLHSMCVKHLRGRDRAVVAFSGQDALILLVGPRNWIGLGAWAA